MMKARLIDEVAMLTPELAVAPNNLEAFWMPYTANRDFKAHPRLIVGAQGMHYTLQDGRRLLDGTAGLWCCNAGHGQARIVEAIRTQAAEMDFAPTFQWGHPRAFELASRLATMMPGDLDHAFFTNSGSEAVDTALKIALAYQRAIGQGTRTRLIGRERGYHGCGFGGISVGGIVKNRMYFGSLLTGVDHLPHTHDLEHNAYAKGQPAWGAHLADELERLVTLHDASTIAAVIVEPVAGSTGVLVPPVGYLQRLREITRKARHPPHLRRGDHRLRPSRQGFGGRVFRRRARHGDDGQGHHVRHGADGGGDVREAPLRRAHERAGTLDRALPRLHLLGPPARLCRGDGDPGRLQGRGAVRARGRDRPPIGRRRCTACAAAATSSTSAISA